MPSPTSDLRVPQTLVSYLCGAVEMIQPTLSPEGDWVPAVFVVDERNILRLVTHAGWEFDEEKEVFFQTAYDEIIHRQAVAFGLVSTIWQIVVPSSYDVSKEPRPRDNPMREEAVMVVAMTAEESLSASALIERHTDGPPTLQGWEYFGTAQMEGEITALIREALRKVKSD